MTSSCVFVVSQGDWMVGAPGAGGQMAYFDADAKLGWAYLRNHHSVYMIGDDPNYLEMERAMYETVRRLEKQTWTLGTPNENGWMLDTTSDSRFAPSQWETALLCNDVQYLIGWAQA